MFRWLLCAPYQLNRPHVEMAGVVVCAWPAPLLYIHAEGGRCFYGLGRILAGLFDLSFTVCLILLKRHIL